MLYTVIIITSLYNTIITETLQKCNETQANFHTVV